MKKVIKIDLNNFFLEDVILQDNQEIPTDCIETICPDSFYRPKWDGKKWVEGLTQAEIDAIKNQPKTPSLEERLLALETLELERMFGA